MKVAVILEGYNPQEGGGFTFQKAIADEFLSFNSATNEYWFITPEYLPNSKHNLKFKFSNRLDKLLYSLRRAFPFFSFFNKVQTRLELLLKKEKFDLAYFVTPTGCLVNFPYIATVWDLEHRSSPWFPELSDKESWWQREANFSWLLPRASYLITGTETGIKDLIRYYGINSINIWKLPHPTPNLAKPDNDYSSKYPKPFFFYPAQFWKHKNHHNLIKGFAKFLNASNDQIELVLVGSDKGELSANRILAKNLGIEKKVRFEGFIPLDELSWLYCNSKGLIYPSFCGPENLPPLEALSLGCPAAVARISGSEEQFSDKVLYFDPANEEDICTALFKLKDLKLKAIPFRKNCTEFILNLDKKISSISPFYK